MKVAVVTIVALLIATGNASPAERACEPTLTTVSGRVAPGGQLCKNQLIFDEQFNTLNQQVWGHDEYLHSNVSCVILKICL